MATKNNGKKPSNLASTTYPRKVPCKEGNTEAKAGQNVAELVTSPAMAALRIVNAVDGSAMADKLDVPTLMETLRSQGAAVNRGDLTQVEAMLMNQATALQSLFARLAERAMGNDSIAPFEANMKMALRAQSQCRATLEALAAIKNPPIVYARQANVTTGPQQVNNGSVTRGCVRARKIETKPNQLSRKNNYELLPHSGTSTLTSRVNQEVEALGKIDRAKITRG